ncbi:PorT family protein [Aurantibacter crassamenti]|uniref:porin family protein n=1 Tax=Aurantibacter crassamenti TaxID=1837375 RepID=UPI001939CF94|nr:porin family protein [Aurantibacter crassamenti]MBM1105934.1 PorT family protein [Aurantibacter crassamenti]
MRILLFTLSTLLWFSVAAQTEQDSLSPDTHYLEDQFYLGITYNFILNKPENVSQRNLSYGLQAGFIKDIPINQDRTFGFGVGLGYGIYSYYTNLMADETANGFSYSIPINVEELNRNKIETHLIEMPIEFRWRTSTVTSYKFYRIYAGAKLGYVIGARSKAVFNDYKDSFNNTDVNKFQYGLAFNVGYSTFNLHVYYALNGIFEGAQTDLGESIEFKPLRIGFTFYIL